VLALVTFGCFAKRVWSPDYPWTPTPESRELEYEHVEREWGKLMDLSRYTPSKMNDAEFVRRLSTYLRRSAGALSGDAQFGAHPDQIKYTVNPRGLKSLDESAAQRWMWRKR
jgi:hypothetical protein